MNTHTTIGHRDQTDAVAQCCNGTYYRYSGATWFAARPWSCRMATHHVTCGSCSAPLVYEEV